MLIWLTGNSGAGKSTLANRLRVDSRNWIILDEDEMLDSIYFGDGIEANNLRMARLASVLHGQGYNILVSAVAPLQSTRDKIKEIIPNCRWIYIKRDGLDRPYEEPHGIIVINTSKHDEEESYKLLRRAIYGS